MRIEFPFEIGDPLHYVETYAAADREGRDMSEILHDQGYTVDGLLYTEHGVRIMSDGNAQEIGSQYACLDEHQALSWVLANRPGSILLTGTKTVKALFVEADGSRCVVGISDHSVDIEEYVSDFGCGKIDADGYAALYDTTAKSKNTSVSMFLLDENGNPVDAVYGAFLMVRIAEREDGLYELVDVKDDLMPGKTPDEATDDERIAFSPAYRMEFGGMTVRQLCDALLSRYPEDAAVHVCGTEVFYGHYSPVMNAMSLDASDLSDLPEYEDASPEPYVVPKDGKA